MGIEITPTLARRTLGAMLARSREEAQMERPEVAIELDVHPDTVRRWEIGETGPKPATVRFLGSLYGATATQISRWCALAVDGKQRGLYEGNNVPPELRALVECEITAAHISSLELEYIPGLLQTPGYLRAIQETELPHSAETAEQVTSLRVRRQEYVFGDPVPELSFVIGFAAMAYMDRLPPDARGEQLDRLREVSELPNVDIRILTGPHAGMGGSFTILTPRKSTVGAVPFVHVESAHGGRYLETHDLVSLYGRIYDAVHKSAQQLEEYLR